jgi:hypothetical protein
MSNQLTMERRRFERTPTVRPCKVRDRRMLLFSAGQTCDVSQGGLLLRVDRARPFAPGDQIDVVVAWSHDALVRGESMTRATVRRVTPMDCHHQAIAIEFESPAQNAVAPAMAA